MAELDVEPVEEIEDVEVSVPSGVDAPEYVLYGGKGGVGKTTMAAATALASARDGTRTLVVSTDPAHSLSDTLETEIPSEATQIRDDIPLFAAEIDPDDAMDEGMLGGENPLGGFEGMFGGADGVGYEGPADEESGLGDLLSGGSMPGADEAAAMRQLLQYLDDDRFDRVVIDTAPTGHTLRLLELPELMDSMVGRLMQFRQRMQGMVEGMKGMFGDDPSEGGMGDLDELRERIEHLRATLRDPTKTDFRIVMVPEEMSVVESKRLLSRLAEFEIPVSTVVVNRVMEDFANVAGGDPDDFVSPDIENCEFCNRRWKVQQGALTRSQELFRGHDVKRVPLFADEVRGERMLELVAACLD
ncbi:ArsA family ATPase [Halalkalicoccus jeotgali]|uniref:Arsenite-activated ATPase ArsA n=1 Tax=Halalkalicoccus jeotgali (strain DSM 18796 / CECT 7217 / JCM 14584 / KCTC 4019 / B3) TaxID=795797 RepID=D8J6U6_HALJB|nr:TRC40/GET3/ArsA family transport-energizing ATPase [Halalkalicoccus jeotgali]ADJ15899.1 arsenite-activated ATPase ArsA [Halalkalicoccus jeotgali B3]ELY37995.1 arsenite-activated ATPase ArsA [Halalkalicoccus jeotgali B3]